MYHYVDAEPPPMGPYADSLTVRTPEFRSQLEYLASHSYRMVDLGLYLAMAEGTPYQSQAVAITFDDRGLDNYTVAFPLSQRTWVRGHVLRYHGRDRPPRVHDVGHGPGNGGGGHVRAVAHGIPLGFARHQ